MNIDGYILTCISTCVSGYERRPSPVAELVDCQTRTLETQVWSLVWEEIILLFDLYRWCFARLLIRWRISREHGGPSQLWHCRSCCCTHLRAGWPISNAHSHALQEPSSGVFIMGGLPCNPFVYWHQIKWGVDDVVWSLAAMKACRVAGFMKFGCFVLWWYCCKGSCWQHAGTRALDINFNSCENQA